MNTNASGGEVLCLSRQRFSPFCLQTCDSCLRAFLLLTSRFPSALRVGLRPRSSDRRQFWRLGFGSRLRVYPARSSILPHRIEFRFEPIQSPFFTDRRFAFSCSPRSDYAAAVTFRYRPAVSDLTGTLTPLRCASSQSHWPAGSRRKTHRWPNTWQRRVAREWRQRNRSVHSLSPFPCRPVGGRTRGRLNVGVTFFV